MKPENIAKRFVGDQTIKNAIDVTDRKNSTWTNQACKLRYAFPECEWFHEDRHTWEPCETTFNDTYDHVKLMPAVSATGQVFERLSYFTE